MSMTEKALEVKGLAEYLYREATDWVSFYRDVLGLNGVVRRHFSTREEYARFEKTDEFVEIQQMIAKLRAKGPVPSSPEEPTKVITVRLPKSVHNALRSEAFDHKTTMNKLCISKLLQVIDDDMVPKEVPSGKPERTAESV